MNMDRIDAACRADLCVCDSEGTPLRSTRVTNRNCRSIIFVQYITAKKTKYKLLQNIGLLVVLVYVQRIPGAFTPGVKAAGA